MTATEIIYAAIGALGIIVGALLAYLGTRGKTRADAKAAADARIDTRVGAELGRLYVRIDLLEKRLDDAENLIKLGDRQSIEMIQHIVHLEQMIPNPPGPPVRPKWKLPILGDI